MSQVSVVTSPVVNVTVTSPLTSFSSEKHFQKDLTVAALKAKLELVTGAACNSMVIEVYGKDDKLLCLLDNNDALIGSYPIDDGARLHVIDTSGQASEFEDTAQVEKYEMSNTDYAQRTDSVRAFKENMKLGRFKDVDPEEKRRRDEESRRKECEEEEKARSIQVGHRCEVCLSGQPVKRGTVMYVGLTDFKPGYWVGVQYDEPLGKHDGSVEGRQYFKCPPRYGAFAKPQSVTVGDFPELTVDELMEL